jgi:hypothetical protein
MSWEIQSEHVDKALNLHRMMLVEKNSGAVFPLDIMLGSGHDGQSCPHCHAPLNFGHVLNDKGMLVDKDGKELEPRQVAKSYIEKLNGFHARMDLYTQRHKVPKKK